MVTDRFLESRDLLTLEKSLKNDVHHQGTPPEFFTQLGTITKVYEDEKGPILFVRGAKAIRIDIQFVDNTDHKRNAKAMIEGFDKLADKCKQQGFSEVIFNSNNQMLKKFCIKRFGFVESDGELRKYL
jgi:hypothetical protein